MANCQDNYVEMPCTCLPPPPNKPRPVEYSWTNGTIERAAAVTFTGPSGGPIGGSYFNFQADGTGALQYMGGPGISTRYINPTTITIQSPSVGTTATATLVYTGSQITGVTMTSNGSGYTPYNYYGYTLNAEPLADTFLINLNSTGYFNTFKPLNSLNGNYPPAGWALLAPSTMKCTFKISGAIKRDTAGLIRMRFLQNGVTTGNALQLYCEADTLTNYTHFSNQLTITLGDTLEYEFYTADEAHLDYEGYHVGLLLPKTL